MQRVKLLFILAIAGSATLCSGIRPRNVSAAGRPSPAAAEPRKSAANPDARPVLVCFGDSLTAGAGIERDQAYPALLQQMLEREGFHYKVINEGVNGNTTKDGVDRLDEVLRLHPQVVVVEFGGNDGLRGLPTTEAERNLDIIVRKLKASGAKVAMAGITLPPQYGTPYIQSFNAMFPAVASRYHVPLLPFILQDVYGVPGDIQEDGVHPTAKGAQQVAANVEHLVLPLLKKQ